MDNKLCSWVTWDEDDEGLHPTRKVAFHVHPFSDSMSGSGRVYRYRHAMKLGKKIEKISWRIKYEHL